MSASMDETKVNEIISPMRKKRVIIGVPGSTFSNNFLISWTRMLYALWESGRYEVIVAPGTSSFVSFARMKTLGLDVLRGKDQKPFDGMDYDVYITIDSDIVFTPEQIIELIENTDIHPVVAGYYMMADARSLAIVKEDGTVLMDMCSEDVSFCKNIQDAGYTVNVNTLLRVGHDKRIIM